MSRLATPNNNKEASMATYYVLARERATVHTPGQRYLVGLVQNGWITSKDWRSRAWLARSVAKGHRVCTAVQTSVGYFEEGSPIHALAGTFPRSNQNGKIRDNLGCLPILDPNPSLIPHGDHIASGSLDLPSNIKRDKIAGLSMRRRDT